MLSYVCCGKIHCSFNPCSGVLPWAAGSLDKFVSGPHENDASLCDDQGLLSWSWLLPLTQWDVLMPRLYFVKQQLSWHLTYGYDFARQKYAWKEPSQKYVPWCKTSPKKAFDLKKRGMFVWDDVISLTPGLICTCVCVCVCERESMRMHVFVCMCVLACVCGLKSYNVSQSGSLYTMLPRTL